MTERARRPQSPQAHGASTGPRTIRVVRNLLVANDEAAAANREAFTVAGAPAVNLIGAPGAGKTSLIRATLDALGERVAVGVIEGDIAGHIDTEAVLAAGARDAVQINTDGTCHLEATMIAEAQRRLDLAALDLVFIENVGNLICPASWDLGETLRVCLVSAAEGHDKPLKYPAVFARSDVVVLGKIDLAPHVDFDPDAFYRALRALRPDLPTFELSCRTGAGVAGWAAWLAERLALRPAGRERKVGRGV